MAVSAIETTLVAPATTNVSSGAVWAIETTFVGSDDLARGRLAPPRHRRRLPARGPRCMPFEPRPRPGARSLRPHRRGGSPPRGEEAADPSPRTPPRHP